MRTCTVCLDDFTPAKQNQYCCGLVCQKVRNGTRSRSGLKKSVCVNPDCRRVFRHNSRGKKYCSWECHDAVYAVLKAEREHERSTGDTGRIFVRLTKCRFGHWHNLAFPWNGECTRLRRESTARACKCCGLLWKAKYLGTQGKIGKFCEDCRALSDRIERLGVEWEAVNPLSVFGRDGWKCQHCGIDTPATLRGTRNGNSPQLDHVLPMAQGGAHSYANTQCLCLSCNNNKGDKIDKEPRLAGAVNLTPYTKARHKPKRTRQHIPATCACGCLSPFTTWSDGANDRYKAGHATIVRHRTDSEGQREYQKACGRAGKRLDRAQFPA